jgi:hypothetical protein
MDQQQHTSTTSENSVIRTKIETAQDTPLPASSFGRFQVKDVNGGDLLRKSPSMDSHLSQQISPTNGKRLTTASTTSTPANTTNSTTSENSIIQQQIKLLNESSQKQLKILNALYASMQKEHQIQQQQQQEQPTLQLLDQLESQLKHLLKDNSKLREENAQLRVEIEQYLKKIHK